MIEVFKKYGLIPASFCLFFYFSHSNNKYSFNLKIWSEKSIDGVLGIRTRVLPGADDINKF